MSKQGIELRRAKGILNQFLPEWQAAIRATSFIVEEIEQKTCLLSTNLNQGGLGSRTAFRQDQINTMRRATMVLRENVSTLRRKLQTITQSASQVERAANILNEIERIMRDNCDGADS